MKSIGKRKPSFDEFEREYQKEETSYQKKILAYIEARQKPIIKGVTFRQSMKKAVVEQEGHTRKVNYFSQEYFLYVARAETLVTDAGFFLSFAKRKEQKLVFTGEEAKDELALRHILQADEIIEEKMRTLAFQQGKKKVLFVVNQEYETAQLALLLNHLDYDTYDVTLWLLREGEKGNQWDDLDPRVRILTSFGQALYTREEYAKFLYLRKYVFYADNPREVVTQELGAFLQREHQRIFGNEHFDTFIMYGEFTPWNYVGLVGIQADKTIHIQNYVLEQMVKQWKQGTLTGKYTDYAVEKRIQMLEEFDEIQCLSKGLLAYEQRNSYANLYTKALARDVLPDRHRKRKNRTYEEVTYEGKEYMARKEDGLLRMFRKVPKEEHAFLFFLDDLSGDNLPKMKEWIQRKRKEDQAACLYIIDNFHIINEMNKTKLCGEPYLKVMRNVSLDDAYEAQFCVITEIE